MTVKEKLVFNARLSMTFDIARVCPRVQTTCSLQPTCLPTCPDLRPRANCSVYKNGHVTADKIT